ncbi:MAG: ice-binding family protein [Ilumatobacteraceae bacterium]
MTRSIRPPSTVTPRGRRFARRLAIPAVAATAALLVVMGQPASAGLVPTVLLATSGNYSVLGGQTVTNTGPSILGQSLGVSPGSAVVGFPPGQVLAPGTIEAANAVTLQGENDLTTAYVDAANRPVEFTQTNPDLVGQTLAPGVYAGSSKSPLGLSGQLVLDGQGNPNAVFIFQTDSTLITSSGSTIELINGASECNVFWQVGSSATLGTGSVFVGNIMALTSISVQTGVVVHGRALARNGAVTLDNDVFTQPSCVPATASSPPPTTVAAAPVTVPPPGAPGGPVITVAPSDTTAPTLPSGFNVTDITLPRTGSNGVGPTSLYGAGALLLGIGALVLARRRRPAV